MANRHVSAALAAGEITEAEAAMLEEIEFARPRAWWRFLQKAYHYAFATVSREEFRTACARVRDYLNGQALRPEQAAERAEKLVCAYTDADVRAYCIGCDESEAAMLVIYHGRPKSGFLFQRSMTLKPVRKGGR